MVRAWFASLVLVATCMALLAALESPVAGQRQSRSVSEEQDQHPDQPAPGMHRMRVRVLDEQGGAVADATVTCEVNRRKAATYRSDDNGDFLADIPTANFRSVVFHVNARGYVSENAGGVNLPAELTVRLKPGVTIGGTVRDTERRPIEGVQLTIWRRTSAGPLSNVETTTDAEGRWIAGIHEGEPLSQFELYHRAYVCSNLWEPIPSLPSLLSETSIKVMKRGLTVRGVVRNQDGEPVAGTLVLSQPGIDLHSADDDPRATRTAADGSFEFHNIPPGLGELGVYANRLAPCVVQFDARPALPPLDVVLESPGEITGVVIDEDGKPVAGARVAVEPWNWDAEFPLEESHQDTTDPEGRFRLRGLPRQGTVTLGLSCGGYLDEEIQEVEARDEVYAFVLERPTVIAGQVFDARTGQPIRTYELRKGERIFGDDRPVFHNAWRRTTVQSADGRFRWVADSQTLRKTASRGTSENAPIALRVVADGYLPAETPLVRQGERVAPVVLRLERAEPVSGMVAGPDGRPVANATVAWVGPKRKAYIEHGKLNRDILYAPEWIVETGDDGRFEFPASREAALIVALHESGYATRPSNEHKNGATLTLTPWARVEGVVQPGGRPLFEAYVWMSPIDPVLRADDRPTGWSFNQRTGEDGRFAFDHVPAVPFSAYWYASELASHRTQFEPRPGETIQVEIGGRGGSASGRIEAPGGLDLQDFSIEDELGRHSIRVAAYPLSDAHKPQDKRANFVARPGADGSFRIDGLPPGEHRLDVEILAPVVPNFRGFAVPVARARSEFKVAQGSVEPLDFGALRPVLLPGAQPGLAAPPLKGRTLAGGDFDLARLRGRPVLLYFWHSGCEPCLSATPRLRRLYEKYGRDDRVAFVGISMDWAAVQTAEFVEQREMPWPQFVPGYPGNFAVMETFGVSLLPSCLLIAADGTVLERDAILDLLQPAIEQELARTQ